MSHIGQIIGLLFMTLVMAGCTPGAYLAAQMPQGQGVRAESDSSKTGALPAPTVRP